MLLHWACVAKSRSEAARWCHEGHVRLDGLVAKASQQARAGQRLEIAGPGRTACFEILELPRGQARRSDRDRYVKPA